MGGILLNKLVCPDCKNYVQKIRVNVESGSLCCPHCEYVMFVYLDPGEHLTRDEFRALLNQDRGAAAGVAASKWFPDRKGKISRLSIIQGSLFIAWMWVNLAGTIPND